MSKTNQIEKPKKITLSTVKSMGFTDSMVAALLPPPELVNNPYYRKAPPMKLWYEADVIEITKTQKFQDMLLASKNRREAANKAVQTKMCKAKNELDVFLDQICVEKIPLHIVRREAIESAVDFHESRGHYDIDPYSLDEDTVVRWMVNYIRHYLTNYDEEGLRLIHGKIGKTWLYATLKQAVLTKIAETYPELSKECERQKNIILF